MTTPPHLAQPEICYVTEETRHAWNAIMARGFLGDFHDDTPEISRQITELDRSFGFQVDGQWVSTCGAFTRQMTMPGGQAVPVAAVTAVTVAPPYRRRGLLTQMMHHQLTDVRRRNESMAVLWASESLIYGRFGYGGAVLRAHQSGQTRSTAFLPSVDLGDGSVAEVDREEFLQLAPPIRQQLLPQRPGALDRGAVWWQEALTDIERNRNGHSALRFVLHYLGDGTPDGYAILRVKGDWGVTGPAGLVVIKEIDAADPRSYARLWRYVLDLDLIREFRENNAPVDDRLRQIVADARTVKTQIVDGTYVRIVDVVGALTSRRYQSDLDLVFEVSDPWFEENTGHWRIRIADGEAEVSPTTAAADLSMGIRELGTIVLGGVSLSQLHRAGRVIERTTDAVAQASVAFGWQLAPWCPDDF